MMMNKEIREIYTRLLGKLYTKLKDYTDEIKNKTTLAAPDTFVAKRDISDDWVDYDVIPGVVTSTMTNADKNFYDLYGLLHVLTVEIELLTWELDFVERSQHNNSISAPSSFAKELNNLIYERKFTHSKFLKILRELVEKEVGKQNMQETTVNDITYLTNNLHSLIVDYEKYNIFIPNKESLYSDYLLKTLNDCKKKLSLLSNEYERSSLIPQTLQDTEFNIPILPLKTKPSQEAILYMKNAWKNPDIRLKEDQKDGLFLINFNILRKHSLDNDGIKLGLIYSYVNWNYKLEKVLVNYMQEMSLRDIRTSAINPLIFIIDDKLKKYDDWDRDSWLEENHQNIIDNIEFANKTGSLNIVQSLLLLSEKGPLFMNTSSMSDIIRSLYNEDYNKIYNVYSNNLDTEGVVYTSLKKKWDKKELDIKYVKDNSNRNTIFNFYFLVKDLSSLIKTLKDLETNGGPQRDRARLSLTKYNLAALEISIRNTMFINALGSDYNLSQILNYEDFSFKHLQMNCGYVRY